MKNALTLILVVATTLTLHAQSPYLDKDGNQIGMVTKYEDGTALLKITESISYEDYLSLRTELPEKVKIERSESVLAAHEQERMDMERVRLSKLNSYDYLIKGGKLGKKAMLVGAICPVIGGLVVAESAVAGAAISIGGGVAAYIMNYKAQGHIETAGKIQESQR